jgi:hypothetical protein
MDTRLVFILEKIEPELQIALQESTKYHNRIYSFSLNLKQNSSNIDIRISRTKNLPLLNLETGVAENSLKHQRGEDYEVAIEKIKTDIQRLLLEHCEERGKTTLNMIIREGAYSSCEWASTEFRIESKVMKKRATDFEVR